MIYVLLGMHKSGTTLLAQMLHESGIPMGDFDQSKGYDQGNKFEMLEPHDLNIEILGYKYKEHSLNISRVLRNPQEIAPESIKKIKDFVAKTDAKGGDWGFKDPRTCLTYNIWKSALPAHKVVAVVRHPLELWIHYRRQKSWLLKFFSTCWKATKTWYVHNDEILRILKETPRKDYFMAEYEDFMLNDRGFKKFCEFTGRPLKDTRDKKMYRSKKDSAPLFVVFLWIQKTFFGRDLMALYEELKALAFAEN